MVRDDAPVLIAGGGASGTIMALLLAQQGVPSIVVEARATPYDIPRAHALNPRTLEICRGLGFDMRRLRALAASRDEAGQVLFVIRLLGPLLGALPYERQDDEAFEFTPFPLINLPQTEFEEILFEAAAGEPMIDFRRGWRWESFVEVGNGLCSTVSSAEGRQEIHSRYLIGCDGAGSTVREKLGIGMSGDPAVLSCLSIIFRADLRDRLVDRPGMLYWCLDPDARGTFLAYHIDRLWSYVRMHPPGPIDMSRFDEATCRRLVLSGAGDDIPGLEILRAVAWTMTSQVADRYGSGSVFLVGDAAHRFPPTGGLGLNTGIQDAHNLAWKLGAVERKEANPGLLGTYEPERRPVAARNADQSLVNARRLSALETLSCPIEIWGDQARYRAWLSEDNRESRIEEAIRLQAEHFDSFGLQLGFCYAPGQTSSDISVYRPSAAVGHRLPHAWLAGPERDRSTLDLLDPVRFSLLAGPETLAAAPPDLADATYLNVADPLVPTSWRDLLGLVEGEALLVRPDGHIAFRGPVGDTARAKRAILAGAVAETMT